MKTVESEFLQTNDNKSVTIRNEGPYKEDVNYVPGPTAFSAEAIENIFTYHPPQSDADVKKYRAIREMGKSFAIAINDLCPVCDDTFHAIEAVRNAVMWANASIALYPPAHKGGEAVG